MGMIGVINAVRMPAIRGLTNPNRPAINTATPFTTATIMLTTRNNPKVLSHLLLTRTRLLERPPTMPVPSSIIAGLTSVNISAMIIPGIINAINPRSIRVTVTMLAANR